MSYVPRALRGNALIELGIVLPLLTIVMFEALPWWSQWLDKRQAYFQWSQLLLNQAPWLDGTTLRPEDYQLDLSEPLVANLTASDRYAFADALAPINWTVNQLTTELSSDNLWRMAWIAPERSDPQPRMRLHVPTYQVLHDDWEPQLKQSLASRPLQMSTSHLLDNKLVTTIQDVMSLLPIARELHSDRLQLGWINTDVVPEHALCQASC